MNTRSIDSKLDDESGFLLCRKIQTENRSGSFGKRFRWLHISKSRWVCRLWALYTKITDKPQSTAAQSNFTAFSPTNPPRSPHLGPPFRSYYTETIKLFSHFPEAGWVVFVYNFSSGTPRHKMNDLSFITLHSLCILSKFVKIDFAPFNATTTDSEDDDDDACGRHRRKLGNLSPPLIIFRIAFHSACAKRSAVIGPENFPENPAWPVPSCNCQLLLILFSPAYTHQL